MLIADLEIVLLGDALAVAQPGADDVAGERNCRQRRSGERVRLVQGQMGIVGSRLL